MASVTSIVVPCVLDSCRVQRYRGIYSSILGVEVIGILNCLWDSLERLCHCHWGNWCFSELDERFLLSIETLIPKELSQMCLCPPNAKVFFKVDCERLCGFYWKGKVWGSSISGHTDSKCVQVREAISQNSYSRTSILERFLSLWNSSPQYISVQMHFKWKPLITYEMIAGSVSFTRMQSQCKS